MSVWDVFTNIRKRDEELDEELQSYVTLLTEEKIKAGISPKDARRFALMEAGGVEQTKEAVRDVRFGATTSSVLQDLAYGVRMLRKTPLLSAALICTLALSIGANTALFSLVDAFMLRPLQVPDARGLFSASVITSGGGVADFTHEEAAVVRQAARSVAAVMTYDESRVSVSVNGRAEMVRADFVSGDYFSGLGATTARGRVIDAADDSAGSQAVAMISHEFWKQHFGRDPEVIGRTLHLARLPVTVIGIMPETYHGRATAGPSAAVILPLALVARIGLRDHTSVAMLIRLRDHGTAAQGQAELTLLVNRSETAQSGSAQRHVVLQTADHGVSSGGDIRNTLLLLMATVSLVLVIAVVNISSMLLSRGAARRQEIAARLSIGATRARIIRQLLTESVVLALLGGIAGLAVARYAMPALLTLLSLGKAQVIPFSVQLNLRLLAFTSVVVVSTGILCGIAPALRFTQVDLSVLVKHGAGRIDSSPAGRYLNRLLVVPQIALSLVLLIAAGLLVQTVRGFDRLNPGYDRTHVATAWVYPVMLGYHGPEELQLYDRVVFALARIPGARSASLSRYSVLRGRSHIVAPDFFATLGIPLVSGRDFTGNDGINAPRVAIVNQAAQARYFPTATALGELLPDDLSEGSEPTRIVGVVSNTRQDPRSSVIEPVAYVPYTQANPGSLGQIKLFVRFASVAEPYLLDVRSAIHSVDPDLGLYMLQTQEQETRALTSAETSVAWLLTGFSMIALSMACLGMYATMSYAVRRRMKEIGIRMALGADRGRVVWLIMRESSVQLALGVGIGVPVSFLTSRLIRGMLFDISSFDTVAVACAVGTMGVCALISGLLPAFRASRADPSSVLRND